MVTDDELATRYGRRPAPLTRRRALIAAFGAALVFALGWAGWYALTTGSPKVTWQNLGYVNTATGVTVTFEITFERSAGPAASAVCTVQALNQGRTQVGRADVQAGPVGANGYRTLRIAADVTTSEPAVTGLVTDCVLTPPA